MGGMEIGNDTYVSAVLWGPSGRSAQVLWKSSAVLHILGAVFKIPSLKAHPHLASSAITRCHLVLLSFLGQEEATWQSA